MKIRIEHVFPPIPTNEFDYSAVDDDTHEPGQPIGYGPTEKAAKADLLEQLSEISTSEKSEQLMIETNPPSLNQ